MTLGERIVLSFVIENISHVPATHTPQQISPKSSPPPWNGTDTLVYRRAREVGTSLAPSPGTRGHASIGGTTKRGC